MNGFGCFDFGVLSKNFTQNTLVKLNGGGVMAYKDQTVVEFYVCRSQNEKKKRNLRAALTMMATGGLVALGGTIDPNETSQLVNFVQNLGLSATSMGAIAGAILTGISHSKYSEYLRLEQNYEELTSSIIELKKLMRRRKMTDEVKEDIGYYKEVRNRSFKNLVNHFVKKYNVAATVSKYATGGACLSATTGIVLPFATKMSPLSAVTTAATGIVVAGVCGFTASNYRDAAMSNETVIDCIENICKDGPQQKQPFPGVECWELV